VPLYGLANTVVRHEAVERWVDFLLTRQYAPGRETSDALFAISQLARYSGDRARDLPDALREQVLARLEQLGADEAVLRPVREYHELEASQESIALGDSLPIGLRLREEDQPNAVVDSASG
jgi:DNA-K related protein